MREALSTARSPLVVSILIFCGLLFASVFALNDVTLVNVTAYLYSSVLAIVFFFTTTIYFFIKSSAREQKIEGYTIGELYVSHKLFLELYKNSPVPYLLIDGKGVIDFPNFAALRLFGLEEEQLVGRNIFDLIEPGVDEEGKETVHGALLETRFKQGVYINNEDVLVHRDDNTSRWGMLSIFPYGNFGQKKGGLLTMVDVTKQKEVDRAKSEFVSLASHQLHTPISAMKWNMELLVSKRFGNLSEQQQQYVNKIDHSIGRMESIINDFLNVSQLEMGTFVSEKETIDLISFLDEVLEEHKGRIGLKEITVNREYGVAQLPYDVDKQLLRHAVGNLVSNAAKYTPQYGTVTVGCVRQTDSIVITISDTGMGIPKDDQEKLFTKFFRASNARKNEPDGTGLGLYIVQLAIGILGGTLSLESVENQGTTFTIVLPA